MTPHLVEASHNDIGFEAATNNRLMIRRRTAKNTPFEAWEQFVNLPAILSMLALFCPITVAQSLFPTEIIYDNSGGETALRHSSIDEFGDEIIFGGTFRDLIIFQFEYFGDFTSEGDETCTIRFYENDGESEAGEGFEPPKTLIYESEAFPIFSGFNSVSLTDIDLKVPNRITWTADFDGISGLGGDQAGLIFRDPPAAGQSFDDIWKLRRSGLWVATRFNANPVANFAARFISKVDLSVTIKEAEILDSGTTRIIVQGPPGQHILVEMSHDLETWTPVFFSELQSRLLSLIDDRPNIPFPRFLRSSLAQPQEIKIIGPLFRDDGLVELTALGPSGIKFKVQSTTDLTKWSDVAEFTFSSREITIIDDQIVENGSKIYRIILADKFEPANSQ